jgi:hypothetical protein
MRRQPEYEGPLVRVQDTHWLQGTRRCCNMYALTVGLLCGAFATNHASPVQGSWSPGVDGGGVPVGGVRRVASHMVQIDVASTVGPHERPAIVRSAAVLARQITQRCNTTVVGPDGALILLPLARFSSSI